MNIYVCSHTSAGLGLMLTWLCCQSPSGGIMRQWVGCNLGPTLSCSVLLGCPWSPCRSAPCSLATTWNPCQSTPCSLPGTHVRVFHAPCLEPPASRSVSCLLQQQGSMVLSDSVLLATGINKPLAGVDTGEACSQLRSPRCLTLQEVTGVQLMVGGQSSLPHGHLHAQ